MVTQSITVYLKGGLGNQLFMLAAGLMAASHLQTNLRVDSSRVTRHRTHRDPGIQALHLPGANSLYKAQRGGLARGLVHRRLPFLSADSLVAALCAVSTTPTGHRSAVQRSPSVPYLPLFIKGYHQYANILSSLSSRGITLSLELIAPTPRYRSLLREMHADQPVALHVRRGDYAMQPGSSIILSSDYYSRALEQLGVESSRPLWWFCDVEREAIDAIPPDLRKRSRLISGASMTPAAEDLLLMSEAETIVIANSTYSWWAAALSKATGVVYPSPWFPDSGYELGAPCLAWHGIRADFLQPP